MLCREHNPRGAIPARRSAAETRGGFTLVEVLLSLMILAMLMASIAVAFEACVDSYQANDDIASATQMARVILGRMMREVRTATDLDSNATELTIIPAPNDLNLTQIKYVQAGTELCVLRTVDGVTTTHRLLGGDNQSAVTLFYVLREDDHLGEPVSVTVRLGLTVDDHAVSVTSSATLRKKQLY